MTRLTESELLQVQEYLLNSGLLARISSDSNYFLVYTKLKPKSYIFPTIFKSWKSGKFKSSHLKLPDYQVAYIRSIPLPGSIYLLRSDLKYAVIIPDYLEFGEPTQEDMYLVDTRELEQIKLQVESK